MLFFPKADYQLTHVLCQFIPVECFEGVSWTGQVVPIVPGGRSIPLSFHSRQQYVDQAIAFRLHEMDVQVSTSLNDHRLWAKSNGLVSYCLISSST